MQRLNIQRPGHTNASLLAFTPTDNAAFYFQFSFRIRRVLPAIQARDNRVILTSFNATISKAGKYDLSTKKTLDSMTVPNVDHGLSDCLQVPNPVRGGSTTCTA